MWVKVRPLLIETLERKLPEIEDSNPCFALSNIDASITHTRRQFSHGWLHDKSIMCTRTALLVAAFMFPINLISFYYVVTSMVVLSFTLKSREHEDKSHFNRFIIKQNAFLRR
jgi:hypothetical protein